MATRRLDRALMASTALGGLTSAFAAMCLSSFVGHFVVQNNPLLGIAQTLVPGAALGAAISFSFGSRGYLCGGRKMGVLTVASSIAYFIAYWVAVTVEIYSPFIDPSERGNVSRQALFIGGVVGAFCTISS